MRLTGLAATDPTDASGTLLFDLARGVWADGVIAALGLPAEKLPPVLRATEVAGQSAVRAGQRARAYAGHSGRGRRGRHGRGAVRGETCGATGGAS